MPKKTVKRRKASKSRRPKKTAAKTRRPKASIKKTRKPKGLKLISIKRSTRPEKKLMATFSDGTTTHFGARGMSDFTKHKDPLRKNRYISRHRARENWKNPKTAGALSLYVLWNKPSLKASIADYKRRFKL